MKKKVLRNGWTIFIDENEFKSIIDKNKVFLFYDDLKVVSEFEITTESVVVKSIFYRVKIYFSSTNKTLIIS
ncbi:hypothetical protein NIE88_19030 [Sporolactobacillus shoreicorticis]|uniref:Uncharacterized protein n=1 Tax=Sporolactobacillus shoreicorticis TaxID=1923877 RepID=A0ABW5S6K4_9BACL|nr:hypothetical protein [Sporolactobacillus shoreicorticis]MCO7127845.1 hypothetical protein [Sporolactobacillus shoreicorticis]